MYFISCFVVDESQVINEAKSKIKIQVEIYIHFFSGETQKMAKNQTASKF